jgi:hypothetical protein
VTHETQAAVFGRQAEHCEGRSPLYARICRQLADEPLVAEIAPHMRWDVPLRLLGGLHYLALSQGIDPWRDVRSVLLDRQEWLARFVAEQGVQTNEVRRCFGLLPCFLTVARTAGAPLLDLVELGPSAGLNLLWDRYRYRYAAGTWGREEGAVELSGEERGKVPGRLLDVQVAVRERVGIDLDPVDLTSAEGALLLMAFVWADRRDRLERLQRAIEVLRANPPRLIRGDYVELLPEVLSSRRPGALTVVFQTASMGYLSDDERERVYAALDLAGGEGPLAWVTSAFGDSEADHGFPLEARIWPGAPQRLAAMDYHGAWLDWLG